MVNFELRMSDKKRILVSPLDWGLGHATRSIPIIRQLLKRNVEVIIGADQGPLALLKEEFPDLHCVEMPGYDIKYPKHGGNMAVKMVFSAPKILKKIKREHRQLLRIINKLHIDAVISDNRYGLWTRKVPTVFMTHQIHVQTPLMKDRVYRANKKFMRKFTEVWVPDFEGDDNLSGKLSHHPRKMPKNVHYIGPLSRFGFSGSVEASHKYDLLAIISGPEPQRTNFEEMVMNQVSLMGIKALVVRGLPKSRTEEHFENSLAVNHLTEKELLQALNESKMVLCRAGYSSIMDLAALGKKAILVPTPGQTEQKYLANYHKLKRHHYYTPQREFDLRTAMEEVDKYDGLKLDYNESLLEARIDAFLSRLS